MLDKTKRQLRIPGSIGKAARKVGKKIQPTLKLSEAPKGEKAKPAKNKKGKGDTATAATATGAASLHDVVMVDGKQRANKPLKVQMAAVSKEVTSKATSGQNEHAKEEDSYEYYTESTSESQSCVQMEPDQPCKRARADYMFAGCAILLIALHATKQWAQHKWTAFSILSAPGRCFADADGQTPNIWDVRYGLGHSVLLREPISWSWSRWRQAITMTSCSICKHFLSFCKFLPERFCNGQLDSADISNAGG